MLQTSAPDEFLYKTTCRANDHFHRQAYKAAVADYTKALNYILLSPASPNLGPTPVSRPSDALRPARSSSVSSAFQRTRFRMSMSSASHLPPSPSSPALASSLPSPSLITSTPIPVPSTNPYTLAPEFTALLHANRSASHCMLGGYASAKEDAEIAIRIRPDWGDGFYRKGEALLGLRQYEEAIHCYEECLERNPTSPDAKVGVANASIKLADARGGVFIRQLLPGRDMAMGSLLSPIQRRINEAAVEMRNFIYIIADVESRDCVVVDACWDVSGILRIIKQEGLNLVGAIVTHHHFDHVGGTPPPPFDQFRIKVPGLATLLKKIPSLTAFVHPEDIPRLRPDNPSLPLNRIIPTPDHHVLHLGARTRLRFLHTPGHTPGSQCVVVNESRLISGDTLFLGCCGRLDLPGGDRDAMWASLMRLREELEDECVIYPGHEYGGEWSTVGEEGLGGALRPCSLESWREKGEEAEREKIRERIERGMGFVRHSCDTGDASSG